MAEQRIMSIEDLEYVIKRAIWTDRKLPKVGQKWPSCALGRMIVVNYDAMSIEDQQEEDRLSERPSKEDVDAWEMVCNWLKSVSRMTQEVILRRCGGAGWKQIKYAVGKDEKTARRLYRDGLASIYDLISRS